MFLPSAASQQGLVCPPLHHQPSPLFLWHHILSRCAWLNCDIKHIRPVTNWAAITFPILPICGSPSGQFSVSVLFNEVMKSIRCFLREGAGGKVSVLRSSWLMTGPKGCTALLIHSHISRPSQSSASSWNTVSSSCFYIFKTGKTKAREGKAGLHFVVDTT